MERIKYELEKRGEKFGDSTTGGGGGGSEKAV